MKKYVFHTDTVIPFSAFNTFGINAKPNSGNPIGFFGTGLKYAVSIILRLGGTIRVFIDGVEYEFFLSKKDFRGKMFQEVRMKKRKGLLSSWQYDKLPFTTELGKNWGLWQAFRELESNTRDENGSSYWSDGIESAAESKGKTLIEISCRGLEEVIENAGTVFFDPSSHKLVHDCLRFSAYDVPSKYLYYRGVRVYDLRYPSRYTYDFKQGYVDLSEDRSARNSYMLFWYISQQFMTEVHEKEILFKALHKSREQGSHFEGNELSFSDPEYGMSDTFRYVSTVLERKGSLSYSAHSYFTTAKAMESTSSGETIKASLTAEEWGAILNFVNTYNSWMDEGVERSNLIQAAKKLQQQVGHDGE
jgi:hypothetical protein